MGKRTTSLDGLRGVAALSVVLLHYVTAFTPFLIGYAVTQHHTRFDHLIATTPLQLPVQGAFAVTIFFVLSGFVLSASFFRHKDPGKIALSAAKRYFRLMPPAFVSIILAYLALRVGAIFTQQAVLASGSSNWLATFWTFPAHFGQAVFQGLYGIWFGNFNPSASYNIVLWTMHFELFGSFLVFMFLALFGKLSNRWLFYLVFSVIFLKTYYFGFVAGMALSDILATWPELKNRVSDRFFWLLLPAGLLAGSWTTFGIYQTFYSRISLPFFTTSQLEIFAHTLGAIIVVASVLKLDALAKILNLRPFQYLGKISFSLYLIHFIILGTFASYLFYHLVPAVGYKPALLLTFVVSMPLILVASSLYTRWVDTPSIIESKRIGNYLLAGNPIKDLSRSRKRIVSLLKPRKRKRPVVADTLPEELN